MPAFPKDSGRDGVRGRQLREAAYGIEEGMKRPAHSIVHIDKTIQYEYGYEQVESVKARCETVHSRTSVTEGTSGLKDTISA